jgi:2,3-bisphosphoglycerate-independent phosphoglycerate mutase
LPSSYPLVALVILDGWGCEPPGPGNAVELAQTPVFDALWRGHPHTTLAASGEAVGLPPGQMGNSEVGHLTIGSGRVLFQDLMRVNKAIEDGSLFESPVLRAAFERGRNVHLIGLVSHGGVHSHIDHVQALLRFAPEKTWIHAFTDGRDVSPTSAMRDLAELPTDRIATVAGRYYAMDRDARWERTRLAFDAIVNGTGAHDDDPVDVVRKSYDAELTDEFVVPTVIDGRPRLDLEHDTAIFFNFRPDRGRQLTKLLLDAGCDLVTMTRYAEELDCPVVFGEQQVENTLAEVLSAHELRQLHAAETEKYAHVTYFFDGGVEEPWLGEERLLVPSPRDVPSYDLKPAMSARELAARFVDEVGKGYGFAVLNFANPDMVGHTGSIGAVVEAVQTVDECLGRVVDAVGRAGGVCLVTADHGNAEHMLEPSGAPHTAHTTNPVPLVLTGDRPLREGGTLADLAPTVLDLLRVPQPPQMTGRTLLGPHEDLLKDH